MAPNLSQLTRLGKLHSVLPVDELVLQSFSGEDHVNNLFDYKVDALSENVEIDFNALIGSHMTVELTTQDNGPTYFDGIVTRAEWCGSSLNGHRYQLVLKPWLWVAGKRRNQRIFHNKSVDGDCYHIQHVLLILDTKYNTTLD